MSNESPAEKGQASGCNGRLASQILMMFSLGASLMWLSGFGWWASLLGLLVFPITWLVVPFWAIAYDNWNPMLFLIGGVTVPAIRLAFVLATRDSSHSDHSGGE